MDTLYNLLGALPHDDAEGLRSAFRRAVKGAHPDLRPGDPDAALRFRQIVRANDILCDRDQRAAYDHLLALAQQEKDPASAHPVAAKIHKIASTVLALTSVSIVTVAGYFLFMHMSMALVVPAGPLAASAPPAGNIDLTARLSASIAALSPVDTPDPVAVSALIAKAEVTSAMNAMALASADAENTSPPGIAAPEPVSDTANVIHAHEASALGSLVLGSLVLGSGDAGAVAVNADQVSQLELKFTTPYVDRGVLFFHDQKDAHAFPDLPPLKRAEKPGQPKSLLAANGKARPDALPKVVPLPQPRLLPRFVTPQPWYASTFQ
jgi:hypothetical protein